MTTGTGGAEGSASDEAQPSEAKAERTPSEAIKAERTPSEAIDTDAERGHRHGGTMRQIHHWIGGKHVAGESGRHGAVWNPATGEQQAEVDFASVDEVDLAVAAAKEAFASWRTTSLS